MTNRGKKPSSSSEDADALIAEALKNIEKAEQNSGNENQSEEMKEIKAVPQTAVRPGQTEGRFDEAVVDRERYLRLAAEYQNFKKRALGEQHDAFRAGKDEVFVGVFDILDSLARGLEHAPADDPLMDGMNMVLSQAENWLRTQGLERIGALGSKFDPQVHEAVGQKPNPEKEDGDILEEVKRGYKWSDRMVRAASVVVCKNEKNSTGENES
jgi:molecular chaperone GrpE